MRRFLRRAQRALLRALVLPDPDLCAFCDRPRINLASKLCPDCTAFWRAPETHQKRA